MPYYVYVAADIWKVAVFHTEIQHCIFWLTTLKRGLEAKQGSTFTKGFGRLHAPQILKKVNHYVAMRSRCETIFHWN